ncbi:MAG: dienelactone hydrolase family protein [Rhodoferax sp.]|uniref:dienelactone hydrolase family protein n=1 Tax=Rhodoferax sp. TaxID=50421 RepID=UPI00261B1BFB|nr:dienelactone hydrolase family protein [Rhodoferax sp.]MDD5336005.1 dienelactone hydrolase family protein [Rhodoferax sp.]
MLQRTWVMPMLKLVLALAMGSDGVSALGALPEPVGFASLDGTPLKAWVFRPTDQPAGTVVALHGCGGLYATSGARRGQLNARHQALADLLLAQGYAVVFPDSLSPRGVAQLCRQRIGDRAITQTQRRHDALATLNWVAAQPWASASKIALLGWSHGGSAVLSATDAGQREVAAQAVKAGVAIAFYPGCGAARKAGYRPNTRLLMLLGALDDWTPPGPCVELGQTVGAEVHVYPDSYHDFDNPVGSVKLLAGIPNGVHPGQGVHAGPNEQAREQAYARVLELLRAAFD